MSKDMEEIFLAKWGELESKVLTIAPQEEGNNHLQLLLSLCDKKENMSSGKYTIISILYNV